RGPDGQDGNVLPSRLELLRQNPPGRPITNHTRSLGLPPVPFAPSLKRFGQGPWRKIGVESTSKSLRLLWEGQPVRELPWQDVQKRGEEVFADFRDQLGRVDFRVGRGIGLLLNEGVASVREVVLEPLANE